MVKEIEVKKKTYAGLLLVALATLMYEILLARIFSVTTWYHFAFMAISVAMFGMTAGALIVYLFRSIFTQHSVKRHLAISSLLFGVSIIFSFLAHLKIPFATDTTLYGIAPIIATYLVLAVPFVFSGIAVCLALTQFSSNVGKLYAADLTGAALGCILLILTLKITDGLTAVIVTALLASLGATSFAADAGTRSLKITTALCSILLVILAATNGYMAAKQTPLLRLNWVKGKPEPQLLYEKWSSYSRITVQGDPNQLKDPFAWGISPAYLSEHPIRELWLEMDASAGTPITNFDGDLSKLEYLKYDIVNLAHHLRPGAKVLVIGTGGGRDILSALAFQQDSVLGVEINEEILNTVNRRYGDFSGHLDHYPQVRFVNDEARSYIARQADKFDIMQVSLIDTFAATAAGAFVLTENSLYTVEAWKLFLSRLTPKGILTFSRWYFRDRPGEVYRLTSLASAALKQSGVANPRDHIIVARRMLQVAGGFAPDGVGTILVSREPFSATDQAALARIAGSLQFQVVLSPTYSFDETFTTLASAKNLEEFTASYPINIAPPTDDNPFFFNMLRLRDIFNQSLWDQGQVSVNMKAVFVLGSLLITVLLLTSLCIIVPLVLTTKRETLRGAWPLFIYFAAIGLGFMLVEISQMQRLIIFLGHPVYSLSVVLFALLLSSGLGSYLTQSASAMSRLTRPYFAPLALLLCALAVFGSLTPVAIDAFESSTTFVRIVVCVALLFPVGAFMGMALPVGMKLSLAQKADLAPWLWGINGATSVTASVLAVVIALTFSISASFWTGFGCYGVALLSYIWASRGNTAGVEEKVIRLQKTAST